MAVYINRNAPESGIASLLAMQGRGGDTELVHMTKPEVKTLMNTGLMSMNKDTGLPEFGKGGDLLKFLIPVAASIAFPAIAGPMLGSFGSSVAGQALLGGLGTAVGGMAVGQEPKEALLSGAIGAGTHFAGAKLFPETFGIDPGITPDSYHKQLANAGQLQAASFNPTYNATQTIKAAPQSAVLEGSEGFFRSKPIMEMGGEKYISTANVPQRFANTAEQEWFNEQINMRRLKDLKTPLERTPPDFMYFYDKGNPTMPDLAQAKKLGLEYGAPPQKYGTWSADEIAELGTTTKPSSLESFLDKRPSFDEFTDTVFSRKSIGPAAGSLAGGLLTGAFDEEVDETPIAGLERTPYEEKEFKYTYDLGPDQLEGLSASEIRALLEKGNLGKFYKEPSSGEGVFREVAQGGLIGLADGGNPAFEGQVPGQGHGMQDNVLMPINEKGGIAAVSPDEYVVPADVMSMIGNGSADSGAKAMDNFIADFRTMKYGRSEQPPQTDPRGALQSLMKT
jgi:hypothetical protein